MGSSTLSAGTKGTAVIIATRGRAAIVKSLVESLAGQTEPPAHIFVIASKADDIAGLDDTHPGLTLHVGRTGSALQRNDGLRLAGDAFSSIVFFDDDFVPSRFWLERMNDVFEARPDIAGLTGTVLADGATGTGIALDDANSMVAERDCDPACIEQVHDRFAYGSNMGSNMAFRYSAIRNIVFDERLPLYAWLEDTDFRGQVERQGLVVRLAALWGVHLGHKAGRGRGITLGYSQIANAVYLARKGTVPVPFLLKGALKNILSNILRSFWPEPFIDRRGRLRGNAIALADVMRGRVIPERVVRL